MLRCNSKLVLALLLSLQCSASTAMDDNQKTLFYCENKGFIPRYIASNKVGDGVCDCCDCSDETGDIFYRGATCETLNSAYNDIVDFEVGTRWNKGSKELQNFMNSYKQSSGKESAAYKLENHVKIEKLLSDEIASLSDSASAYEKLLNVERENYEKSLKDQDPILLEFNSKFDLVHFNEEINTAFGKIEYISKAYTDLCKILDELTNTFSYELNDKFVNDNIEQYNSYITNLFIQKPGQQKQAKIDIEIDRDQKYELQKYFKKELPTVFNDRYSEFPKKYIMGKINFVRSLIIGRVNYTQHTLNIINDINNFMSSIAKNYNVNFQDLGVLNAVRHYENFSSKYAELIKVTQSNDANNEISNYVTLPDDIVQGLDSLYSFINQHVPTMELRIKGEKKKEKPVQEIDDDQNDELSWGGLFGKIGKYIPKNVKINGDTDESVEQLEPAALKKQIQVHETKLNEAITSKEQKSRELEELRSLIEKHEKLSDTEKKQLDFELFVKSLRKRNNSAFCITDKIDNYMYEICLNTDSDDQNVKASIHQKELGGDGNTVRIGELQSIKFENELKLTSVVEHLNLNYADNDIMLHLVNETTEIGKQNYLFKNLPDLNNGLTLRYAHGEKCWNGPHRSATVFFSCAEQFKINSVTETTKCNYFFDVSSPLGCNSNFQLTLL